MHRLVATASAYGDEPSPPVLPAVWSCAELSSAIGGVHDAAFREREAAAADAAAERVAEPLQLGDALVDACAPRAGEPRPVGARRHGVVRQLGELGADLLEREADLLREYDERDAPEHSARIAAMPRFGPPRLDEALLFVETKRRGGDPGAARNLAYGQRFRAFCGHDREGDGKRA